MTKKFGIGLLLLTFILLTGFISKPEYKVNNFTGKQGVDKKVKAPDFALTSTEGKTVKLSDYKGKIVIVDFWATWCPPCRKGVPDLIDLQSKYKEKLLIIGISLDYGKTKDDVKPFIKNYGINYPVVYYDEKVLNDYGGIESIPTSFIIDSEGNVVNKHVGLYPKYIYEEEIKELLKSK